MAEGTEIPTQIKEVRPIVGISPSKITEVRPRQFPKAELLMLVTPLGISMEARPLQPEKADSPFLMMAPAP